MQEKHTPQDDSRVALRLLIGGGALALAVVLGVSAALLLWLPSDVPSTPRAPTENTAVSATLGVAQVSTPTATASPTSTPTPYPTFTPSPTRPPVEWTQPTAAPDVVAAALDQPVGYSAEEGNVSRALNPLTIIPARARSTVITYTVQKGDTLRSIADKFGLSTDTIIWSNDRFYVNAMRVGLELNILPVDGVYHRVQGEQTIAEIAKMYGVDPYAIIDSEFNTLFNATPQTVLPEGLYVVVPGGKGSTEPIYWDPGVVVNSNSGAVGTGVNAGTTYASFAVGDPGSCGRQAVIGGSPPVNPPIWRHYVITQDFSWQHGGIDLAVPEGTPVYAAGGGTVIFSGWSTWGYGYTVVIAHGGTLSIYGHLNGSFVRCGETVTAGQNIAVSGNSGHSSGPHLHFEIRGASGTPVNPWNYQSF